MGVKPLASLLLAIALALASLAAHADFTGKVVAVADGDTVTVLRDRQSVKVRLMEIDAPEKAQAFGNRSKQSLSAMVYGKDVLVVEHGTDKYRRTLGRIYQDRLDVNAEQVRQGMAWVYDRYVTDRGLYALQDEAKAAKRGLWTDADPMPPWKWRHK